ncbi:arylsulfatase [Saccharicrinis sp. FJH54]|uniref:arylsulfatase n=1 Tax=Saccharicrinis sp. FJH54 TaxID=3344665 RepID=UPI0035D4050C
MNKSLYTFSTVIAGSVLLSVTSCQPKEKKTAEKPNIIYILADDLGYGDVSCYGQSHFKTPNIDRLAQMGMKFTRHYAGSTVCAPSRSSLMTGMHTGHTPIRGNKGVEPEGQVPMDSAALTIAEVLKTNGYVTGAFGKWGLGFPGSEGDPNFQGFDEFFGYNSQTLAHNYYPYHLWHNQTKVMLEENQGHQTGAYAPNLIHKKALQFLENNRDTSFFLFYPTIMPHAELVAPEEYMDQYREKFLPEKTYEGVDDGPRYRLGPYGSQDECHAAFAAMIKLLDDQVGEIIDKVEELGLSKNTLIIFTSDNGPHKEGGGDPDYFNSNGPFNGYKRDLYEGGIREPMIAAWKGHINEGSETDHISAFWDVMPTVCDMIGTEAPMDIDGISFLPTMLGKPQKEHDYLYWEFHEQGGKQAVLIDNWKGIKFGIQENPDTALVLFDLTTDTGELHNVADQHPEMVERMDLIMLEEHHKSDLFPFEYEEVQEPVQ